MQDGQCPVYVDAKYCGYRTCGAPELVADAANRWKNARLSMLGSASRDEGAPGALANARCDLAVRLVAQEYACPDEAPRTQGVALGQIGQQATVSQSRSFSGWTSVPASSLPSRTAA